MYDIRVHFCATHTIKLALVKVENKLLNGEQQNFVYEIICHECDEVNEGKRPVV